jgi:limonene-1,2-epoxide hydrolase
VSQEIESVVSDFCEAWRRRNLGELLGFFSDDGVYHNMMSDPLVGKDAIRGAFEMFLELAEEIELSIEAMASQDDLVFTERVDRMTRNGQVLELPVAGVFEVRHRQLTSWRDYFDMQTWSNFAAKS